MQVNWKVLNPQKLRKINTLNSSETSDNLRLGMKKVIFVRLILKFNLSNFLHQKIKKRRYLSIHLYRLKNSLRLILSNAKY
jgi:hypothetical protein